MFIKLFNQNDREEAISFKQRIGGELFQLNGCQLFHVVHPEGGDEWTACGDLVFAVTYSAR